MSDAATKTMTKHIRNRVKVAGIKASAAMTTGGMFRVSPVGYGVEFTEAEQRRIKEIAVVNGLTSVRGLPIDLNRMTDPHGFEFQVGEVRCGDSVTDECGVCGALPREHCALPSSTA